MLSKPTGDSGKSYSSRQRQSAGRISSCLEKVNLCFIKVFSWLGFQLNRIRSPYIMESNLLDSKSTNLNVNLVQSTLTETPKIVFDQISGHHCLARLTHKINRHSNIKQKIAWKVGTENKREAWRTSSLPFPILQVRKPRLKITHRFSQRARARSQVSDSFYDNLIQCWLLNATWNTI